jgi:hypothetical protein
MHSLAIVMLLCSTASDAQTLQQSAYKLQDAYLPSRAMRVFIGSQADTLFPNIQSQVIQQLHRDSSDLRISPDSLMWLRFVFKNNTNDSIWRLATENNNIRQMLLFNKWGQVIDSGGYSVQKSLEVRIRTDSGADRIVSQKIFIKLINQHTSILFRLDSAQTDTFYLLIRNPRFRTTTYIHLSSDEKNIGNTWIHYEVGKLEMMLFIYVLFTIVLLFLGRDWLYFYYFLYALGIYFYYVASSGLGFCRYWDRIEFETVAFLIGSIWVMTAFFLVWRTFLDIKTKIPVLNQIINGIVACGVVVMVLSLLHPILTLHQWVYDFINILFLIGLFLILIGLFSGRLKSAHQYENWLFIFALMPVFVSSFLILCCEMDFTGHRILDAYNKYACLSMSTEMFLVGILLSWRVYKHILNAGRAKNEAQNQYFNQQLANWKQQEELQTQKNKVHRLIHHYLTNDVMDILSYADTYYESDTQLITLLYGVLSTCKVGDMVIHEPHLVQLLSGLVEYFNKAQVVRSEDAPSLTMIYDEKDVALNNIQLNLDFRSEIHGLFREALGNMRKYARFQYAFLAIRFLTEDSKTLLLELKDDGVGLPTTLKLDVDEIHLNQENYQTYCENNGLKSFFQTAHKLGGTLTIDSKRHEGTIIKLLFSPNSGEQVL